MGGSSTTSSTTTGSASPKVQENIDKLVGKVGNLADQDYPVFNKSLYPGLSTETQGGIQGLLNASDNGIYTQGAQGALGLASDVAAGNRFGEAAPGYADLRKNIADTALTDINSAFSNSGRLGGSEHLEAAGRGVTNALANLDYTNYQNDIARQERAAAALPGLLQGTAAPAQMQLTGGGLLDADAAAKLQGDQDLFIRQERAPYQQLGQLSGILAGNAAAAGTTTTETKPTQNPLLGLLGAGLAFL